jgi:hypothetical protein
MKKRGLGSPDNGDALALTFAYPVGQSDHTGILSKRKSQHEFEYNPFESMFQVRK